MCNLILNLFYIQNTFLTAAIVMEERFDEEMKGRDENTKGKK